MRRSKEIAIIAREIRRCVPGIVITRHGNHGREEAPTKSHRNSNQDKIVELNLWEVT